MKKILMLSAGGTAVDVLGLIDDINAKQPTYEPIGYLDDADSRQGTILQGLPVVGRLGDFHRFAGAQFVNCLGSPSDFWRRGLILDENGIPADRCETIVHPSAVISRTCVLGTGTIVYPHAFIGAGARIGLQVLVMAHTSINHDVTIGDHTIIASGAIILGKVSIGARAYIGAGVSIRQNASVGDQTLVGMGSVVLNDIGPGVIVAGTPPRLLRQTVGA